MILLSKVIKSSFAKAVPDEIKTISIKRFYDDKNVDANGTYSDEIEDERSLPASYEEKAATIISSAEKEAAAMIERARLEADQVLKTAEAEKQKVEQELLGIKEEAKLIGQQEGFQQGIQEGKIEYESFIAQAKDIVSKAQMDYRETIDKAEPVILDLAIAISEKIIGTALEKEHDLWSSLIKQVIQEVKEHEEIKIYVHPLWYEKTIQQKEELRALLSYNQELLIYPDTQLSENGCILETPFGRIDASVDSQLLEIKKQLLEKLKEEGDERS